MRNGKIFVAGGFVGLVLCVVAPSRAAILAIPRQACQQDTFEQAQQFWVPYGQWSTVWYADTMPDVLDCPVATAAFDMTQAFVVWSDFHVSATAPIFVSITRQSFASTTTERKVLIDTNYSPGEYDVGVTASFPSATAWDYFDVQFYDQSGSRDVTSIAWFKGFGVGQ
jgi:hypothetical protein